MDLLTGETKGWTRIFDAVNEAATEIYLTLDERMRERGLLQALGSSWVDLAELRERLGIDPKVAHRFDLAMEGLRNLGVLKLREGRARLRTSEAPKVDVNQELSRWAFGPLADTYLELYRTDAVFDPAFALAFDEGMDEIWDGLLNAPINRLPRDLAVDWVSAPGTRVLDLGFGTPHTLKQLADSVGPGGEVCGLDISEHFVRRAKQELAGVPGIGQLVLADINDGLPMFEDGSFDGVMFMGALHFVDDPSALFRDLARIMRPDARLVIGMFFVDRPCYAGPAFQLHRTFFDPPGTVRSETEVVDALWQSSFSLDLSMHLGSYCTLYLEQRPEAGNPSGRDDR